MTTLKTQIDQAIEAKAEEETGYDKHESYEGLNLIALDQCVGFKKGANYLKPALLRALEGLSAVDMQGSAYNKAIEEIKAMLGVKE